MSKMFASLKLTPWGSSTLHFLQVRSGGRLVAGVVFESFSSPGQVDLVRRFLAWARTHYVLYVSDVMARLEELGYCEVDS